jgi:hypothetical protein
MILRRPASAFIALLVCVFLTTAIADIVIVIYTRALANRDVTLAVAMAMSISMTKGINILLLTSQPTNTRRWLVQIASAFGMGFGTWLGLLIY